MKLAAEPAAAGEEAPSGERGRVVGVGPGCCTVQVAGMQIASELSPRIARRQRTALAVGDEVLLELEGGSGRVVHVLPRRTLLSRPDPRTPNVERVLAVNIDVVVIVVAARNPGVRPGLVDRVLIAVERGGARPLICMNKIDLLDPAGMRALDPTLDMWRALGHAVHCVSATRGDGLEELRRALVATSAVLVGHSGVGKSSILNGLSGNGAAPTGAVRPFDGKGRHTTTGATFYDLGEGTQIIDTPGIRSFGLWKLTREELTSGFVEMRDHAARCRYRDCLHIQEPGCAVRSAVAAEQIHPARYKSYLRLLEEL